MNVDVPKDSKLHSRVVEANIQIESIKAERGAMDHIFGSGAGKSQNIAGFALIIFCICFFGVLTWMPETASFSRKDALTLIAGLISTILGFIFGKSSK